MLKGECQALDKNDDLLNLEKTEDVALHKKYIKNRVLIKGGTTKEICEQSCNDLKDCFAFDIDLNEGSSE